MFVDFSKETVTVVTMLYKNMKAIVCLPDSDTDFFNIATGVLQEYILAPYSSIIHIDYEIDINRSNKRKWVEIKKKQEAENIPQKQ